MRFLIGLMSVLALLAAGCGMTEPLGSERGDGAAAVEVGGGEGSAPGPAGGSDDDGADDGGQAEPADETANAGVETVSAGDAGEVDVRVIDDNQLELLEVREASGWGHRVDDAERTEIEIDFRHDDGRSLELEIKLEGGRLDVELG